MAQLEIAIKLLGIKETIKCKEIELYKTNILC